MLSEKDKKRFYELSEMLVLGPISEGDTIEWESGNKFKITRDNESFGVVFSPLYDMFIHKKGETKRDYPLLKGPKTVDKVLSYPGKKGGGLITEISFKSELDLRVIILEKEDIDTETYKVSPNDIFWDRFFFLEFKEYPLGTEFIFNPFVTCDEGLMEPISSVGFPPAMINDLTSGAKGRAVHTKNPGLVRLEFGRGNQTWNIDTFLVCPVNMSIPQPIINSSEFEDMWS